MRIPPLTALRTFECAGRRLSFTQAADELSVTPGAVSRQIRVLEDFLSVQLFHRANREVSLTKEGKEYLEKIADAFTMIKSATEQLMEVPEGSPLRVSTSSTFTLRWMMPRMHAFYARRPPNNLQLTMNLAAVDFQRDDLDATIKLGHEDTPHSVVRRLFLADLVAVCSPRLLKRDIPLERLSDLSRHTLLHSTARPTNWKIWLQAAGVPDIVGAGVMNFESSSLAYQAAAEGVGIAIAQLPLILEDLESGNLVMPFPIVTPDSHAYNLIWPDRTPRNPSFRPFRDWMLDEAGKTDKKVEAVVSQIAERRSHWVRQGRLS